MKYQILEHRADLKIRAFGKTKEELFLNMVLAVKESQNPEIKEKKKEKREIKVKSSDIGALLVDFLNELLYLSQVNQEVYNSIEFKKLSETELEGDLICQKVKRFGEDIKAATYHNLEVYQKEDLWQATILFDI